MKVFTKARTIRTGFVLTSAFAVPKWYLSRENAFEASLLLFRHVFCSFVPFAKTFVPFVFALAVAVAVSYAA